MFGRSLSLLIAISLSVSASPQERCLSHRISAEWLQKQGLSTDLSRYAAQWKQLAQRRGGVQTVPVAVHVVWNTSAENVPDAAIMAILDRMNEDYQAQNADFDDVRPPFLADRANAEIEFCLASTDPNGNSTSGITRTHTDQTWFDPENETDDMKSPPDGISSWDPYHYLNIWICDISSGATGGLVTTGYAYLPVGGMVGSSLDGLVLDYDYATDAGDRTATHEVGHYFGLDHPWGSGNCSPGDGIGDTPPTDSPTFSCSNTGLTKCGALTQYENFMDYSNCPAMFTNDQAAVMSGVLNGVRAGLLNSNGCNGSPSSGPCIPTSVFGPGDGDFIDGVVLGTINNTTTGSATSPAYSNFTSLSTDLFPSTGYTIAITGGDFAPDHYAAWIDYDGNNGFDSSEKLGEFETSETFETQSIAFTVPANANVGNTVLRVRGVYFNTDEPDPADPCFNYAYCETEDYGINIADASGITDHTATKIRIMRFPEGILASWSTTDQDQAVTVTDASGRTLLRSKPEVDHCWIPTSTLANGMYLLTLTSRSGRAVARFLVNPQ